MYKILDIEEYRRMGVGNKVGELRKWVSGQLDNHKSVLRVVAGETPEINPDLEMVMSVDLRELPTMMNDYEEDSTAYAVLKYRMENAIDDCDDSILDSDMFAKVVMKILPDCDGEEDTRTISAHQSFANDMITICTIFCFDDLRESFTIWRP
jgi:hypothetical protein